MDYKKQQRENERAYKSRGNVLHTSVVLHPVILSGVELPGVFTKQVVGGTYKNPKKSELKKLSPFMRKAAKKYLTINRISRSIHSGKTKLRNGTGFIEKMRSREWISRLLHTLHSRYVSRSE